MYSSLLLCCLLVPLCGSDLAGHWRFAFPSALNVLQNPNHAGWTNSLPYYPQARIRHASTVAFAHSTDSQSGRTRRDDVYFFHGGVEFPEVAFNLLDDAWVYSFLNEEWTPITISSLDARADGRAVTTQDGEHTYVYGGVPIDRTYRQDVHAVDLSSVMMSISSAPGTGSLFPHIVPVVLPRVDMNNGFVVLGGCDPSSCNAESYDGTTGDWASLGTQNMPLIYHASGWVRYLDVAPNPRGDVSIHTAIHYIFGGASDYESGAGVTVSSQLWTLQLHLGPNPSWTMINGGSGDVSYSLNSPDPHPGRRRFHSCSSSATSFNMRYAWCVGGTSSGDASGVQFGDLFRYDMQTNQWQYLSAERGISTPAPANEVPSFDPFPDGKPGSRLHPNVIVLGSHLQDGGLVVGVMGGSGAENSLRLDYWEWEIACLQEYSCFVADTTNNCHCVLECGDDALCPRPDPPSDLCEAYIPTLSCFPDYCLCPGICDDDSQCQPFIVPDSCGGFDVETDPCHPAYCHCDGCMDDAECLVPDPPDPLPPCLPAGGACADNYQQYCRCPECVADSVCVNVCSISIACSSDFPAWCHCSHCLTDDDDCEVYNRCHLNLTSWSSCFPDNCNCPQCLEDVQCYPHCADGPCFPDYCDCSECSQNADCSCKPDGETCAPDYCDCESCADEPKCDPRGGVETGSCLGVSFGRCFPGFCHCPECAKSDIDCVCAAKRANGSVFPPCFPDYCDCENDCGEDRTCQDCFPCVDSCSGADVPSLVRPHPCLTCMDATDGCISSKLPFWTMELVVGLSVGLSLGLLVVIIVVVVLGVLVCLVWTRNRKNKEKVTQGGGEAGEEQQLRTLKEGTTATTTTPSSSLEDDIDLSWSQTKDADGSMVPTVRMSLRHGSMRSTISDADIHQILAQHHTSPSDDVIVEIDQNIPPPPVHAPPPLPKDIDFSWSQTKDTNGSMIPAVRMSLRRGSVRTAISDADIHQILANHAPSSVLGDVIVEIDETPAQIDETPATSRGRAPPPPVPHHRGQGKQGRGRRGRAPPPPVPHHRRRRGRGGRRGRAPPPPIPRHRRGRGRQGRGRGPAPPRPRHQPPPPGEDIDVVKKVDPKSGEVSFQMSLRQGSARNWISDADVSEIVDGVKGIRGDVVVEILED